MPSLKERQKTSVVKMLQIGDSGTGKTAALLSLAKAGYNLRILDFDNGIDILSSLIQEEKNPEELFARIQYCTCTDAMKSTKGGLIIPDGQPRAFARAVKMMNHWQEDDADLGPVKDWGPGDILVIDSLTFLSNAAMRYHLHEVNRVGNPYQQDWLAAQRKVISLLELLYSESVKCNVVINAHIRFIDIADGMLQGYPESVGKALPPQIPRYFNTVVQAKISGTGKSAKRKIRVVPDTSIGLKNAAPHALTDAELPLETGLADIFRAIRGKATGDTQ